MTMKLNLDSAVQKVPIKVTALINDTTGTLVASCYTDQSTKIGCIFGTGCNGKQGTDYIYKSKDNITANK